MRGPDEDRDEMAPDWVTGGMEALARDSDLEIVSKTRRDAMDPAGTYVSDPENYPLTSGVQKDDRDGRLVVTLSGLLTLLKPDKGFSMPEDGVKTRLNYFKLSPDRRNRVDYETKEELSPARPDSLSLRWLEARDAYFTVYGEEAKQDLDVVKCLVSVPIHFRLFQGNRGLGVGKIWAKKDGQR